jgi:hypothetical protein
MALLLKITNGKTSLARGIHCCPIFSFSRPASLYCEEYVCVCVCVCVYICIHISDCLETVCALPLLPNNTAGETFLHQPRAVRSVDWIFIVVAPAWRWLGEYVTLDNTLYSLLFKQELVAASVTSKLFLSHSSTRPLLEIYNYTMH